MSSIFIILKEANDIEGNRSSFIFITKIDGIIDLNTDVWMFVYFLHDKPKRFVKDELFWGIRLSP